MTTTATYYYTYVVGNLALASIAAFFQMLAIPLAFVFPQLLQKMNVATLMMVGFFVSAAGWLLNFFAVSNIPLLCVAAVFTGAGTVPASMLSSIALMECADVNEWHGIAHMEGSMSALNGLVGKIGGALGTAALGIILDVSGVSVAASALAAGTIDAMPSGATMAVRILFSLAPFVLYIIVGLTLTRYDLGKKLPGIRADLEARRAADAAANS